MVFGIFSSEDKEIGVIHNAGTGVNEDVMWFPQLMIKVEFIVAKLLCVGIKGIDLIGAVSDLVKENIGHLVGIFLFIVLE
jgi:hypothetical protein